MLLSPWGLSGPAGGKGLLMKMESLNSTQAPDPWLEKQRMFRFRVHVMAFVCKKAVYLPPRVLGLPI